MTIDISLFELHKKVGDDPNSTPEQIEAINTLIDWVNDSKKSHLENHKLFSKLYIIYFGQLIQHFQDVEFAQKEIHRELSESIGLHSEFLRMKINSLEFSNWFKSIGFNPKDFNFMTDEEIAERDLLLKNNQEGFLKNTNKWSQEKINEALNNQISEAINKFSHYD